ncbi:hypothetical protein ACFFWC_07515 [Plantactinospora siamensis]|uniref:Uncharacterized protein n=1 Tax=Plantactinospora siamensis TaxID=555372 RepID=A0ABV6NXN4_9ACTN
MRDQDEATITAIRRLDAEPPGPSRVNLRVAMAEGRRRRRVRRTWLAGGAAAAVALAVVVPTAVLGRVGAGTARHPADPAGRSGSPAAASPSATAAPEPTSCSARLLSVPNPMVESDVTGGDPSGRIILGRWYRMGAGQDRAVLVWTDGRPTSVDMPGSEQSLDDANPAGTAVGSSYHGDHPTPYVYQDGRVRALPGVEHGRAWAINEAGRIVGDREQGDRHVPVVWPAPDQPARDLSLPGPGWRGSATDVDAEGNIVGEIKPGPGKVASIGFVWPAGGGSGYALPMPTVKGRTATSLHPISIGGGWVTGAAYLESGGSVSIHPVRLRLADRRYVPFAREVAEPAVGNGRGWVAGGTGEFDGAMLTDSKVVRLPLLANPPGRYSANVGFLSDDGRTVGGQLDDLSGNGSTKPRAVVWRCR